MRTTSIFAKKKDLDPAGYTLNQHAEHVAAITLLHWVKLSFPTITVEAIQRFWERPYMHLGTGWLMMTVKADTTMSWRAKHSLIKQLDAELEKLK